MIRLLLIISIVIALTAGIINLKFDFKADISNDPDRIKTTEELNDKNITEEQKQIDEEWSTFFKDLKYKIRKFILQNFEGDEQKEHEGEPK